MTTIGAVVVHGNDTEAIESAWAIADRERRPLFFPPGDYQYDGPGLSGHNPNIHGAGRTKTVIRLGLGSRLIDTDKALGTLDVGDFDLVGGAGLLRSTKTTQSVEGMYRVTNASFTGYTGACIEHNSVDMPYWKFRDLIFDGANFTTTMGVALSGLVDGCSFENVEFLRNRVHIKARAGAGNAYIRNCDFIRWSAPEGHPRVDVWIVPREQATNSGTGFTITASKFGSENMAPGDKRIAYADEGPGASNGERFPLLDTPSAGYITEHTVTGVMVGSQSGAAAPPIYSTTPNVRGCRFSDITISGSVPEHILEYLTPPPPDRLNGGNVIGPVHGHALGIDGDPAPLPSNGIGVAHVVDPNGVLYQGEPRGSTVLLEAPVSGYSRNGVTSVALEGDAVSISSSEGKGSFSHAIPNSISAIRGGIPTTIQFDARSDAIPALRTRIEQSGGHIHFQRTLRLDSEWRRYRLTWVPRSVPATMNLMFFPVGAGSFEIARVAVIQGEGNN